MLLEPVRRLFSPPRPLWACEITPMHVVVAGVDASRKRAVGKVVEPLPRSAISGSLSERNIVNPEAVVEVTAEALKRAGSKGFEISLVIPDDASRISFLVVEKLSGSAQEREAFIRWKLRKSVPFEVDTAQIAYHVLGAHIGAEGRGLEVMVALSPRSIVQEYEGILERLDLHAGYVIPSSVAALNLVRFTPGTPAGDVLLVKIGPDSIATTIFQSGVPVFYRRVGELPIYDAVYPTMMYYQDKLGGSTMTKALICGYDRDPAREIEELQDRFGLSVQRMDPTAVEDIYKPALGAAGLL